MVHIFVWKDRGRELYDDVQSSKPHSDELFLEFEIFCQYISPIQKRNDE